MNRPASSPQPWRVLALIPVIDAEVAGAEEAIDAAAAARSAPDHLLELAFVGLDAPERLVEQARQAGADRVWQFTHAALDPAGDTAQLLEMSAQALQHLAIGPGTRAIVMLPASLHAEEIAVRMATRMDGAALGRCSELRIGNSEGPGAVEGEVEASRPAYGGRARLQLRASRYPCFALTHQSASRSRAGAAELSTKLIVEHVPLQGPLPAPETLAVSALPEQKRPLEGATMVVSGGRGMRGEAGFALLQQLADQLDAALGASLPAVDAGWVPVARQVGYSGKYVTPRRYLAVAISGTAQHLAGIGPDTEIIAINKDPDADIFRVASVGVAADWEVLLPALIEALKSDNNGES